MWCSHSPVPSSGVDEPHFVVVMRPALWSVLIQATGSAATIAAALLVASQMGLAAQGEFALLRTWNDALVTIAVIGLPQGLLHMQYRESVSVAALRRWVNRYAIGLACACALLSVCAVALFSQLAVRAPTPATVLVMAVAVPLAAAHLLWRSLALRDTGVVVYAVITAAPSCLTLAALVPISFSDWRGGFPWALLVGAGVSALLSGLLVRAGARRHGDSGNERWSRRTLWSISFETGAQNVLIALSPPLMLSVAGVMGAPLGQIGVASLGLHVYQLFGIGAAYIAPMVYDRAARADKPLTRHELWAWLRARTTPRVALGGAVAAVAALGLVRWLWPAGADSMLLLSAMAAAGVLSMGSRLLITLLLARGVFRPLTHQAFARLVMCTAGTALLMRSWPATVAVPAVLAATEVLLLAALEWLAKRADGMASGGAAPQRQVL